MPRRRAAHFANYAPDDDNDGKDGSNPHVGSGKVRDIYRWLLVTAAAAANLGNLEML